MKILDGVTVYFKYDEVYVWNDYNGKQVFAGHISKDFAHKAALVRRTMAVVDFNHCLSIGTSLCSPKDNFDRKKGRKVALARALKSAFPSYDDKPLRKSIWEGLRQKGMRLY
jgi:hypothetical protein